MTELDPALLPDLPIPFMNEDHVREVALVNDLEAALAVHTREHFLREEAMMREARFPAYPAHKGEHDRVLAEMDAEARAFRARGDAARLSRYLGESLPAWYVNHVRTMDVVTASFVAGQSRPSAHLGF